MKKEDLKNYYNVVDNDNNTFATISPKNSIKEFINTLIIVLVDEYGGVIEDYELVNIEEKRYKDLYTWYDVSFNKYEDDEKEYFDSIAFTISKTHVY